MATPPAPPGDAAEPVVAVEDLPKLSLDLLELVKNAQQQNGLRHSDYLRYRQYCTRRLRRIRKSVGMTHGKGRKYVPLEMTPHSVQESRHLMVPLFLAERVWAHAMELKQEMVDSENSRLKFHLMRELKKAARWGKVVTELCQARCDARTALEAEAYGAVMGGHLALELEEFSDALSHFSTASRICSELGTVGTVEQQDLFAQRVEELKPRIRYCRYQLDMASGGGGDAMTLEDAGDDKMLQAKLKAVLSESLKSAAEKMDTVQWCGHAVPVRSEQLRMLMLQIGEKSAEAEAQIAAQQKGSRKGKGKGRGGGGGGGNNDDEGGNQGAGTEFEVFTLYDDALRVVGQEKRAMEKMKSGTKVDEQRRELVELGTYLTREKLERVLARNQRLLDDTALKLQQQTERKQAGQEPEDAGAGGRRPVRPDDLVHLYDLLIDNLDELIGTVGDAGDDENQVAWEARRLSCRTARVFYVAETYALSNKWAEAQLLYDRASELGAEAMAMSSDDKALPALCQRIDAAKSRAKALWYLSISAEKEGGGDDREDESKGDLPMSPRRKRHADTEAAPKMLQQRQAAFDAGDPTQNYHLIDVPPALRPIPCKPLFFDIASNSIKMPDLMALSGEKKKKKKAKKKADEKAEPAKSKGWLGGLLG